LGWYDKFKKKPQRITFFKKREVAFLRIRRRGVCFDNGEPFTRPLSLLRRKLDHGKETSFILLMPSFTAEQNLSEFETVISGSRIVRAII